MTGRDLPYDYRAGANTDLTEEQQGQMLGTIIARTKSAADIELLAEAFGIDLDVAVAWARRIRAISQAAAEVAS